MCQYKKINNERIYGSEDIRKWFRRPFIRSKGGLGMGAILEGERQRWHET
jgi:hypothetical protein